MNRLAVEVVAILGLAFLGASCIIAVGGQDAAGRPPPVPVVQAVTPTAAPKPAPTSPPPTAVAVAAPPTEAPAPPAEPTAAPQPATAAPEPTLRPVMATAAARAASKPTAVPAPPPLAIAFTGEFDPRVLRVGQKLVIKLGIENKSTRPIEGLRIFTTGPWDKYTVVSVVPNGRFESGMIGYNVYSGMTVPPGQTRFLSIVANPNEPGNHDFSFIPNQDTTQLKDEKGEGIVIGGKVAVTR